MDHALHAAVNPKAEALKKRTAAFADAVADLVQALPNTTEGRKVREQLFAAATSVAANYRAACRARSPDDFISKIGLVVEEADECHFWLALLIRQKLIVAGTVTPFLQEANELAAIFTASHKTASERAASRRRFRNQR
jgi:four helix bundle protein